MGLSFALSRTVAMPLRRLRDVALKWYLQKQKRNYKVEIK